MQGDAEEKIGVDIAKAPAGNEKVDHAARCGTGGRDGIGVRFNHDPCFVERMLREWRGRFD